jgi:hypothetical protein
MNRQRMLGPALAVGALVVALAVAGIPVLSFLPYLVFLACPIMMFLMMSGSHGHGGGCHGGHGHTEDHEPSDTRRDRY